MSKSWLLSAIFALLLFFLVPHLAWSHASPFGFLKSLQGCKKGQIVVGLHQLKLYLAKFGYLENPPVSKSEVTTTKTIEEKHDEIFDENLEKAIKTYQLNYRLNVTGHLDASTIKQMMKPRCGFADIINGKNTMQRHDKTTSYKNRKSMYGTSLYAFNGGVWPSSKYHLTYQILSKTLVSGTENMRSIVAEALNKWAQHSPFTFKEVPEGSQSNLVFGFFKGYHGDGYPFDGPGGVLAHSFSPTIGQSHYDSTESWSDNPGTYQIDLNSVVLHEIGHVLGLAHSEVPSAVMYSGIRSGERKRVLQEDDIQGIQALYGSK